MKICRRCEILKKREEFYLNLKMADGRLNICKECVKKRIRKYNRENPDLISEQAKKRYHRKCEDPLFKQRRVDYLRQWRTPEIRKAHNFTQRNLKDLKPEKCEKCKIRPAQMAHHPDYTKPDEVEWICYRCHNRLRSIYYQLEKEG